MGVFLALGLFVGGLVLVFRASTVGGRRNWFFDGQTTQAKRILLLIAVLLFFGVVEVIERGSHQTQSHLAAALFLSAFVLYTSWFASLWKREFLLLMSMTDEEMPGRNDKMIWAIVLIAFAPIGLWLFRSFRRAHWPHLEPAADHGMEKDPAVAPEL